MSFSAQFVPTGESAVDLALDDDAQIAIDPQYTIEPGIAAVLVRCHYFPDVEQFGLSTRDALARTRLLIHTHLESLRSSAKFAPPIRKPMARNHVVLYSAHANHGVLRFTDGTTTRNVFAHCWLDRIDILDQSLVTGISYNLTFVSESDPVAYL